MEFSSIHPQIPLGLQPGSLFHFNTFVEGKNALAVGLLKQCATGEGEQQIYLWGKSGNGKSHLLQAACQYAANHQRTVCYFTAQQIFGQSPEIFDNLEQLQLICLDELEQWLVDTHWQEALFDLINRVREQGNRLIMASLYSPEAGNIGLSDLRSRLGWGPVFQLHSLSDTQKVYAMQIRAKQSGLVLSDSVAQYLLQRYPRNLADQFQRLDILDREAMSGHRPLTIPLIKSVFPEE